MSGDTYQTELELQSRHLGDSPIGASHRFPHEDERTRVALDCCEPHPQKVSIHCSDVRLGEKSDSCTLSNNKVNIQQLIPWVLGPDSNWDAAWKGTGVSDLINQLSAVRGNQTYSL